MSKIYKPKNSLNQYCLVRDDGTSTNIRIGISVFFTNKGKFVANLFSKYTKEDLKEIIKAIELEEKRREI